MIDTITVFGVGSLGGNLILQLMKMYPNFSFIGVDYDVVEERNVGIQPYILQQLNMPKVHAISILGRQYNRKLKYQPINKKIVNSFVFEDNIIYVDCFDNIEARKLVTSSENVNIFHVGFSPLYAAEGIWNENYKIPTIDIPENLPDVCEMRDAIPFINFVVSEAVIKISKFIDQSIKEDFIITNKDKLIQLTQNRNIIKKRKGLSFSDRIRKINESIQC